MHALSAVWLTTLATTIVAAVGLCMLARRYPGRPTIVANCCLAIVLLGTSAAWIVTTASGRFSAATSLPFALCDVATLVAAVALVTRARVLVELTYFWGLAGTIQSLITPDLNVAFPRLEFFEYVLAHAGIVCAALVLVVGERIRPSPRAVPRVFVITLGYTAFVGLVDWVTGGNYMYLRQTPGNWTLLSVLGPWPWYMVSAAGVAIVLFTLLDLPFWQGRARVARLAEEGERTRPAGRLKREAELGGGVRAPLALPDGRVRDHAGADRELSPPDVGDPAELDELVAFPAAEGRASPSDHDARIAVFEDGPRDIGRPT